MYNATHCERCTCPQFNRRFTNTDAVLFKSHCQVCRTSGMMMNVIPKALDARTETGAGRFTYARCSRYPACTNEGWTYCDSDLEHSDERLSCEDAIWDRRSDAERESR